MKTSFLGDPMFSIELCVRGLEMFNDDMERVAEWLLSGEARMFEQGGGLEEEDEAESSRFKEGRTLATIVGRPPALCYLALQLFKDNKDAAMNLLFDGGAMYVLGCAVLCRAVLRCRALRGRCSLPDMNAVVAPDSGAPSQVR